MIRVVLADDHAGVRQGIRQILADALDIEVVGEAADGVEALELVHLLQPHVLILDIRMPNMDGMELMRRLHAEKSPVSVLVLSAHASEGFVSAMIASGAASYLNKSDAPRLLVDRVHSLSHSH
jgi:DNA-binding NarL/FixJ family response regulator